MALFDELNGRGCSLPIGWFVAGGVKPLGFHLVNVTQDNVSNIQAKL